MKAPEPAYVAVDLGAGSGRVIVARFRPDRLLLNEVRRFHYEPTFDDGHLEWRAGEIFNQIKEGLREAGDFVERNSATITSIGVDSWGVDYGLIDANGRLCGNPFCYRDRRTEGIMEKIFRRMPRQEIYARTGIQFLPFNTLFQLAAHVEAGIPAEACRLLLMPDLFHFLLTGKAATEFTNATTTQMIRSGSRQWDTELIEALGLPAHLLSEVVEAGTSLGALEPAIAEELGVQGATVVVPATHDTASAVAGTPLEDGIAYISSGTWSLVGVERSEPLINPDTALHNFTNEGGAYGTTRFLKNVMGLWIFESCRREWIEEELDVPYDGLFDGLDREEASSCLIYPDDSRFFAPGSMLSALAEQVRETGQDGPSDAAGWTKTILDSLALRYTSVIRTIERVTGKRIEGIRIVGGGSRNDYLNQVTATASGVPVWSGPAEATAAGNALVQAVHAGRFRTLHEARRYAAAHVTQRQFQPRHSESWADASRHYAAIEARYQGV